MEHTLLSTAPSLRAPATPAPPAPPTASGMPGPTGVIERERHRSMVAATRVRLIGALTFLGLLLAISLATGRADWQTYPLPTAIYAAAALCIYLLRDHRFMLGLSLAPALLDVAAVFYMQRASLPLSPFPAGVAGFSLGIFALVVALNSLSLRSRLVFATAIFASLAQVTLMRDAAVSPPPMIAAAAVLVFVAWTCVAATGRLRRLAAELAQAEVARRVDELRAEQADKDRRDGQALLEQTQERNARLTQLQHDKENLVQLIAHDLRSPLTVTIANLQLLQMIYEQREEERTGQERPMEGGDELDGAVHSARRVMNMISDMLDVYRFEEGQMRLRIERYPLAELVEEVRRSAALLGRAKQVSVDVAIAPAPTAGATTVDDGEIESDRALVLRILENLSGNAVRYAPRGSRILVSVSRSAGECRLSVHNHGTRIPPEARARLFEKFGQGEAEREARRNWGLGLHFCRLAVDALSGQIAVEDTEGWDATFTVRIPTRRHPEPPSKSNRTDEPAPRIENDGERSLHAEGDRRDEPKPE